MSFFFFHCNIEETSERGRRAHMGFSEHLDAILN